MRTLLLLPLLFLVACAKANTDEYCQDFSDTLWVADESYSACMNTTDNESSYKVIAFSGGDLSIIDTTAYKADLVSKFTTAKTRASKVIYFSARPGMATGAQYSAAVEAATEQNVTVYDLYSMSLAKPDTYPTWVMDIIQSYK